MGAPGDRNLINFSVNAGVTLKAPFEGRDDDTVGLGFGIAQVSGGAARLRQRQSRSSPALPFPVRGTRDLHRAHLPVSGHRLVAGAAGLPVRVQSRRRHPEPEQSRPSASATKRSSGCAALSPSDDVSRTLIQAGGALNATHSQFQQADGPRVSRTVIAMAGCAAACIDLGGWHRHAGAGRGTQGLPGGLRRHSIVTSTVPANGDQNPYAIVVAPVSAGKIQEGDVLVDNFNDRNNLQGLGSTIVNYRPTTKKLTPVRRHPAQPAAVPRRRRPDHGDDDAEDPAGSSSAACRARTAPRRPRARAA